MQEKYYPPPPPTFELFEIKNQNKGIEDILDIDSHCPHLLFGETTSHLTSNYQFFTYGGHNIQKCAFLVIRGGGGA